MLTIVLAACSPRELPPQLSFTPGPIYSLTDRLLVTGVYTVETPAGWRVIAGPAEDPYTFQFIAPENDALIVLSNHAIDDPPLPAGAAPETLTETPALGRVDGLVMYAVLVAPADRRDALTPVLDAVIASLR